MNIGEKILGKLRKEISQNTYERYIKKLHYDIAKSSDTLVIFIAPNILISKWVQNKYSEHIAYFFEVENGIRPEVNIIEGKYVNDILPSTTRVTNMQHTKCIELNPHYTFDNFIVGASNQFTYTTALSVAKKPGMLYNPLFIYGGVGLGKTHLLHAIGHYQSNLGKKVVYVTLEEFMNSFISGLRKKSMGNFRKKFRECDVLLIDDIQFLSQKEKTQDEFFHTFNQLYQANKQIVMTSDRQPKKIAGLVDRLQSRFEWGLMANMQPPELETKIAIIKSKCKLNDVNFNDDIIHYIAINLGDNVREIEGAIIKINALSSMLNQPATLDFAQNSIKEQLKEKEKHISIDDIVSVISRELNVKPSDITSKKRTKHVVNARRIVIYIARNLTINSMSQIALYFGMKDYTTISHTIKKIHEIMDDNAAFKVQLEELSNKVESSKL